MKTIDPSDLANVTGGASKANMLSKLIKNLNHADLSKKQIGKLETKLGKLGGSSKKFKGNAIAEGDFGAPASSFIPITGD